MVKPSPIKIFLAHASGDKPAVLELYERLKAKGYNPWLDKKSLVPGQNWREEIPNAIKQSDVVIACLSKKAVSKQGYVQQELRLALTEYAQKPPGSIYLIPLKLEPCEIRDIQLAQVGVGLRDLHWLDYWESDGFEQLVRAIEYHKSKLIEANRSDITLTPFNFEIVGVNSQGQVVKRSSGAADYFAEDLGNNVTIEMVLIPGGSYLMGVPNTEEERLDREAPQHSVTIASFFMGKFLVTQTQWKAISLLPKIDRDLLSEPSRFQGAHLPIERVSWEDAIEFCQRLSLTTGHDYRLPSEAEWEYACRAGTTTPFYFGETITPEIVNYDGNHNYGSGPRGEYRLQTTDLGSFPPNAFGLYDMHGNVFEWCQDYWHDNYQNAPTDGSAWTTGGDNDRRVYRGGSWIENPGFCRSSFRDWSILSKRGSGLGFRLACSAPRTR